MVVVIEVLAFEVEEVDSAQEGCGEPWVELPLRTEALVHCRE